MKLLYVCHEPLPSPHANTEQIVRTTAALAQHGIEVELFTPRLRGPAVPPPRCETTTVARFYGISPAQLENGFALVTQPVPTLIRGQARLPWHDAVAAVRARRRCVDVVYVRDPFALVTALLSGRQVVFETFRTDLNERAHWAAWRRFCYTRPNLLGAVTHSHLAARGLHAAGMPADRVLVAHNGVDVESAERRPVEDARAALGLPSDRPLVVYAGNVTPAKGLDSLLAVAAALPTFRFVVLGHVPGSEGHRWMEERKAAGGIDNVTLAPRVPPAEVAPYLAAADYLMIPPSARPLVEHRRTVLPLKTFQYLAAGRPIVAPDLPDLREVLRHDHNAVLVPPDHPEEAARALRALAADPERRARLGEAAARAAKQFSWSARGEKIANFLRRAAERT